MWTTANRPKFKCDKLRYPSDLTGAEWAHIEPLIPPAKHGGRKRKVDLREVVNVPSTGCQWAMFPRTFHPKARSTIISIFGPTTARW
jgi:transposase